MSRRCNVVAVDRSLLTPIKRTPLYNLRFNTNLLNIRKHSCIEKVDKKSRAIFSNAVISNKISKFQNLYAPLYLQRNKANKTTCLKRNNNTYVMLKRLNDTTQYDHTIINADTLQDKLEERRSKSTIGRIYQPLRKIPNLLIKTIRKNKNNATFTKDCIYENYIQDNIELLL